MSTLFDTHCHLQDPAFDEGLGGVLARAEAAGVGGMVVCGYDAPSNERALRLRETSRLLHPAVGFHPHDARDASPSALQELEVQAHRAEVVAVGEIGLDFYRELSPRSVQARALEAQLAIAIRVAKPVSVHSRGAESEILEPLARYAAASPLVVLGRPVGVMHCFGGTLEQARSFVELGFLISIPCSVTYPKNNEGRRIAAQLPLESLVAETDCPYLPPQTLRGGRNEPAYVRAAVEAVALARGAQFDEVARVTSENACRLFAVSIPVEVTAR